MSSYQDQCMLGNVMRDSHPDYLTCGYCAKEFLLDNITMFIAHKTGGCDQGIHFRSTTLHDAEDTSAPLTCSSCSRVFMTARGLLRHVQEDHQMVLCLQKGPLFLPHQEIRPPPAHSSFNGAEFTRTQAGGSGFCLPSSVSSCVQNDEPTDLSLTCSTSLAKARITCNEDKCKITIEPTCNAGSSRPPSALPKKRKFLFSQQSPGFESEEFGYPAACDIGSRISDGYEDVDSGGSYENSDPTTGKQIDSTDVSICVTAEYQEDTLCCVSLSTEKKEHDKHAKLKRLLQNKIPATEPEMIQQGSDAKTTTVVYKVPFLAPSDPESAVLKATANETSGKDDSHKEVFTATSITDTQVTSSDVHKGNTVPRLAMNANIDRLIRTSISSDAFSEEPDMLSIYPELSLYSSRQPKHHRLDDPGTPMPSSPCLLLPGEKNTFQPRMSVSCPSLDDTEKGSINSNIEHWSSAFLNDDPSLYTTPGNPSVLSPALSAIKSLHTGISQNEAVKLKNSSGLGGRSTPISDKATKEVFSDLLLLRNHQNDQSSKQLYDNHTMFGEGLLRLLERKKTSHTSPVQSQLLKPAVSTMSALTGGNQSIQHWLSTHNEDSTNISGIGSTSRPTSAHFDPVCQENVEQASSGIQDETSGDSKGVKRRRYPTSRPFKCPNCDQAFNQRIHLKKHMSKHTGVKPFKCQQCDYSTVERSHLKVHYRIHTGEKPYRCLFCDYATAQNSTLKIHMKRHHETPTTSDCSNVRDNYQPTGSYDEDNWTLQDNFFLNPSMNTPALDDELHRSSFLPGSRASRSLPMENSSLCQMGDGYPRAGSSSPLTPTDQAAEPQMYVTSMQQVQTAEHVAGHISFLDAECSSRRKLAHARCGHFDNSDAPNFKTAVVKNTYSNLDTAAGKRELGCHSSEDSTCFGDNSKTGAFGDIKPSSVQVFMIQKESKLQPKNEDLYFLNNKAQLHAKSFAKRKQIARQTSIQTGKSMKSHISELEANCANEKDVPKEKELIHVFNNNAIVPKKNENTSSEVNATETFTAKESMEQNTLLASELTGVSEEDDKFEFNSEDAVPVTIPNKAFVRG